MSAGRPSYFSGNWCALLTASAVFAVSVSATLPAEARSIEYLYTDPQGTVIATADEFGSVTNSMEFKPFGDQVLGGSPESVGFAGHLVDDDVALVYMQQRYYDPEIGRFLSTDPLITDAKDRYTYANQNPYRYVDPDGRDATAVGDKCDAECKRAREEMRYFKNNAPYRESGGIHFGGDMAGGSSHIADAVDVSKLNIIKGVPGTAVMLRAPDGRLFYAPSYADYRAVLQAGQDGGADLVAMNKAIGHYGSYDYQRIDAGPLGKTFYPAYTDAANFSVGVYMFGAGFSASAMTGIGKTFAWMRSSNAGDPAQASWWRAGWDAAKSGQLPVAPMPP